MAKVLVLYYSTYGHIEAMANAVAQGAREAGATADIKRVPELVPAEIAEASHYKLDQAAPIAKIEDLVNYTIIVGTGTRFGRISSQMANFLDQAGGFRPRAHWSEKSVVLSPRPRLSMAVRKPLCSRSSPIRFAGQKRIDEVPGCAPYGATTIAGGDGSRQLSENELAGARYQGRAVAETAIKLHG